MGGLSSDLHVEGTLADHVRHSIKDNIDLALHLEGIRGAAHLITYTGWHGGVVGNGAGGVLPDDLKPQFVIQAVMSNRRRRGSAWRQTR